MEEEGSYENNLRQEEMLPDEDGHYESEEENIEAKPKEKPVGPPLELEIPLRPPPAHPEKVIFVLSESQMDAFHFIYFFSFYKEKTFI